MTPIDFKFSCWLLFYSLRFTNDKYNLELRGVYGCYDYSRKETISFETEYDQENVIDQEYLKEVFQDEKSRRNVLRCSGGRRTEG